MFRLTALTDAADFVDTDERFAFRIDPDSLVLKYMPLDKQMTASAIRSPAEGSVRVSTVSNIQCCRIFPNRLLAILRTNGEIVSVYANLN